MKQQLGVWTLAIGAFMPSTKAVFAQNTYEKTAIFSPYTVKNEQAQKRRAQVVKHANDLLTLPIGKDEDTAYPLDVALWNVSQFMVRTPASDSGVARLVAAFDQLHEGTQRSLLEVVYGQYPGQFATDMQRVAARATHPRTFAMAALHWYRAQPTPANRQWILQQLPRLQANDKQKSMLASLQRYLYRDTLNKQLPPLDSLFAHQQQHGFKVVYSFQRAGRDYPGLAIVQQADGSFARDAHGKLLTFVQLARSASNMPYFLTNGSTPQGLFVIQGTAISRNPFIGPTPNLQTAMMFEVPTPRFTHYMPLVLNAPPEVIYRSYFPPAWQQWGGLLEAYEAGRAGRGEIIAHGSTIDPEWFAGMPFYPLSPTLGCLSGLELWNTATGKIDRSDQFDLVDTFLRLPGGDKGYLIVIDVNDMQAPISPAAVAHMVDSFEAKKAAPPTFPTNW